MVARVSSNPPGGHAHSPGGSCRVKTGACDSIWKKPESISLRESSHSLTTGVSPLGAVHGPGVLVPEADEHVSPPSEHPSEVSKLKVPAEDF